MTTAMLEIRDNLDCSKIVRGADLLPTGPGIWPPKPWTSYQRCGSSMTNYDNRRTVTVLVGNLEVTLEQFGADTVPHLYCIFPAPAGHALPALPSPHPALSQAAALARRHERHRARG